MPVSVIDSFTHLLVFFILFLIFLLLSLFFLLLPLPPAPLPHSAPREAPKKGLPSLFLLLFCPVLLLFYCFLSFFLSFLFLFLLLLSLFFLLLPLPPAPLPHSAPREALVT